jgi:TatA/E family protein of Tat protein translocase
VSFLDTIVVVIVVFLVFGPDKVPEVARAIGRGMREFRKAMAELERGVEEETAPVRRELTEVSESTNATLAEARKAVTIPGSEPVALQQPPSPAKPPEASPKSET